MIPARLPLAGGRAILAAGMQPVPCKAWEEASERHNLGGHSIRQIYWKHQNWYLSGFYPTTDKFTRKLSKSTRKVFMLKVTLALEPREFGRQQQHKFARLCTLIASSHPQQKGRWSVEPNVPLLLVLRYLLCSRVFRQLKEKIITMKLIEI